MWVTWGEAALMSHMEGKTRTTCGKLHKKGPWIYGFWHGEVMEKFFHLGEEPCTDDSTCTWDAIYVNPFMQIFQYMDATCVNPFTPTFVDFLNFISRVWFTYGMQTLRLTHSRHRFNFCYFYFLFDFLMTVHGMQTCVNPFTPTFLDFWFLFLVWFAYWWQNMGCRHVLTLSHQHF